MNAEHAFVALRGAYPSDLPSERHIPGPGWGGVGLPDGIPPDWAQVDAAPLEELVEVIRPGGLPNQKAKGIKAALRAIHEARGDYSLEFLGEMTALEARTWLTGINGIGVKTASVVLLFSFGMPLMPVDRHVERVARRVGLLPPKADAEEAHDYFLGMLEPDEMHEAHVNLIRHGRLVCHARNPVHAVLPAARALPLRRPEGALAPYPAARSPLGSGTTGSCPAVPGIASLPPILTSNFRCITSHGRLGGRSAVDRHAGQALVEFAFVIPLFLAILVAIVEFALLFNAQLAVNYASRDAALVAAEAGNSGASDCSIVSQIDSAVRAPADPGQVLSITIAWTDANGTAKSNGGIPYSNVWTRTGTTTCVLTDGTSTTLPYVRTTNDYPEASRCTILAGCGGVHVPSVDTVAVRVTYRYLFHTPLGSLLGPLGSTNGGWTLEQSNAMRMEPVL